MAAKRLDWTRDEVILALDVYVSSGAFAGGSIPGQRSAEVLELSQLLRSLNAYPVSLQGPNYRNRDSVYLKFMNLRAIQTAGQHGMKSHSQLDAAVWRELVDDLPEVQAQAASIRARLEAGSLRAPTAERSSEDVSVEKQHTEQYVRAGDGAQTEATRAEQQLVHRFRDHLEARGLEVVRKRYWPEGELSPLYSDLWIPARSALIEAKSSDSRRVLREAMGQLFDYRRFHNEPILMAVLLPYKPTADKLDLLQSVCIYAIWPYGDRFRDTAGGRLV